MKKNILLPIFLLIVSIAFAWPSSTDIINIPGATHGWDTTTSQWKPFGVTGSGTLNVTIGDLVIASETIGLVDAIDAVEAETSSTTAEVVTLQTITASVTAEVAKLLPSIVLATATHPLVAGTAYEAGNNLGAGVTRKWIEISSSTDEEFWVDFGATTATGTVGVGRRCVGNFLIETPHNASYLVNVIASTAMQLYIIEGGY